MPIQFSLLQALKMTIFKPFVLLLMTSLLLTACDDSSRSSVGENNAQAVTLQKEGSQKANAQPDSSSNSVNAQHAQAEQTTKVVTILALGDSLTEGLGLPEQDAYPAQLQAIVAQQGYDNVKVINAGLSGETSTGLVNRLDWILKTKPDITILTTGGNDAMRGIDTTVIEHNIRTAIARLQAEGSLVVLGGMEVYENLGEDYVTAFTNIYPKIAQETDVAFIPKFVEGVGGSIELNQADRIHPTKEGYKLIIQNNILPVLEPLLDTLDEVNVESNQTTEN